MKPDFGLKILGLLAIGISYWMTWVLAVGDMPMGFGYAIWPAIPVLITAASGKLLL